MEINYRDALHLIEKGYKKLGSSISEILKDPKEDIHHIFLFCQQNPCYQLSVITTYTTTLTPWYKQAFLKNIGAAKAKENQVVVTAKNGNEKMNKKISTRVPHFPSSEKHNTITTIRSNNNNNSNHNKDKNNSSNSKEIKKKTLITMALPTTDDLTMLQSQKKKHQFPKKYC